MSALQITPLGHACVLIEVESSDGQGRLLLDPGNLAEPLEQIPDLGAILITHAHPDHLDAEQVRRATGGRDVPIYGDAETVRAAAEAGIAHAEVLTPGEHRIAGVRIEATLVEHETIYPGVPLPANLALRIADRILAPGDAFWVPGTPVEILLAPTGAPWMKLSEAIDYVRAVAPAAVLPIHDGGLGAPHRAMHRALMTRFAPEGTTVLSPDLGERLRFPTS